MTTVCLVTTGQPSSNPRLVKEADTLSEAGFRVHVIGAHWAEWADQFDARDAADRAWTLELVEWRRDRRPARFWVSRIRHRVARSLTGMPIGHGWILPAAVSRLTPELTHAAARVPANLYVAHNLGALPAAVAAAGRHGGKVGFDAEDFHSGEFADGDRSARRRAIELTERRFVPRCDYLTAAAPGIADAYEPLSRVGRPTCILNVFRLDQRPAARREAVDAGPLRLYWFSQTIGPNRGLEDIARAVGRLPAGTIEVHLRGSWQAGFRETLLALARESGATGNWLVSLDPAPPEEMIREAASCDIGLALEPGTTANSRVLLSNKVFTYLLAGLAVVATRTEGQDPLVRELGDAVWGYRPGDVGGLVGLLTRWLEDRQALGAARARAWFYGETRYNWDREKTRLLDAVARVVAADVVATTDERAAAGTAG